MKKIIYKKCFLILFVLISLLINPQNVLSQWSLDPAENTLITDVSKDQKEPTVIPDGSGGIFISWRDYRFTESIFGGEIYAQKLNSSGVIQWVENGKPVNAGAMSKGHFRPLMSESGNGEAIVVWERGPLYFYNSDIVAQKLNGNGERTWPLNDVTIADTAGTKFFHKIISDQADGAFIAWQYLPGTPGSTDIYAQRVDFDGNTLWKSNGVEICMAQDAQSYPDLACDGNKGAIITWSDSRAGTGTSDIYAQLIDSTGAIQWQEDGVAICNNQNFEYFPVIVADGNGGAIITWEDNRSGSTDIYAQRINASGELQWTTNGIPICSVSGNLTAPDIISDGTGGAIIIWQDDRDGNFDIYAQRVNSNGEVQWTTNGIAVSNAANNQLAPVAIEDGVQGVIIVWQDFRYDAQGDIYAQRLNVSGTPLWQVNGIAISTAEKEQDYPVLTTDGDEGAIFVWQDKRNGTDYDIYAQHIDKNGHFGEAEDEDQDGIPDQEEKGPQGTETDYDGNNDNKPDRQQKNVASFFSYDKQFYVTLSLPDSVELGNVAAVTNPNPDAPGVPVGASFPCGFFRFTITGLSAGSHTMATMTFNNDPIFGNYYKYGPTPGQTDHWYDFDFDGETGAVIRPDTVFLHLTDGKRGDHDLTANGVIVDPGGPIQTPTILNTPGKDAFYLEQNHPNPAINKTTLVFAIPEFSYVRLEVFDIKGKLVTSLINKKLPVGKHTLPLQTGDMPEGIYILKLTAGEKSFTKKMVIGK